MEKLFMNPNTGSVDTFEGWGLISNEEAEAEGLIEVGQDDRGTWVEQKDNNIILNGVAYYYDKPYYDVILLNTWRPTSNDGASPSSRVLPNNDPGYEFTEMGEVEGHLAIMSYIVYDEDFDGIDEDDLGQIDWESRKNTVTFI